MINEYFRPNTIVEALALLTDEENYRKPLGGGTHISRQQMEQFGVVDLQKVGLDQVIINSPHIEAGAMVRLGFLLSDPQVHQEIKRAIRIDAGENIRNMATLGGWLITSEGRSVLATLLLALDATLSWEPDGQKVQMGDWFPLRFQDAPGVLLTAISWRLDTRVAFEYVARSPKDRPSLIVAAVKWGSGRTRIALGGWGDAPIIAMDGPDDSGVDVASHDAYYDAEDSWASALYRREIAAKLALRCIKRIDTTDESEV